MSHPIPLRLGELEGTVRELATIERRSLNRMLILLVEEALTERGVDINPGLPPGSPGSGVDAGAVEGEDEARMPLADPAGDPEAGAGHERTAGVSARPRRTRTTPSSPSKARAKTCEHRVPAGAFCKTCDAGSALVPSPAPLGDVSPTGEGRSSAEPPPGYVSKAFADTCPWRPEHVQGQYCPVCDGDHRAASRADAEASLA